MTRNVYLIFITLGLPEFLYKSNSTIDGWHPRPFEDFENPAEIKEVFVHDDPRQGLL